MSLFIVLVGVVLLLILVLLKLNSMLALLIVAILTGIMLGMPVAQVMTSVNNGIGATLGSMAMVLALGAMLGKLAEDNGIAQKLVAVLIEVFGVNNIQWAVLLTGLLVGIPLFYNAGFVVLIPLVFAIASVTGLPALYVGLPMATALSVTHGFLPPHPGPIALTAIFKASVGTTLLYGLLLSVPIAVVGGILFPRIIIKVRRNPQQAATFTFAAPAAMPSASKSFIIALLPVILIGVGTIGGHFSTPASASFFAFFADPTIALLLSVIITFLLLQIPVEKAMASCVEGVKSVAIIILIIAAGGAFKQILLDSNVGEEIKSLLSSLHLSPLFLGWFITAVLRIVLGSATVSALTASGIVLPLIGPEAPPELMVLAVGAGSLTCSHVNDTGFWMFKEYFNLTLKQTFQTWTAMESIVSFLGLIGVLLINMFR